jgi:hypothetical protein
MCCGCAGEAGKKHRIQVNRRVGVQCRSTGGAEAQGGTLARRPRATGEVAADAHAAAGGAGDMSTFRHVVVAVAVEGLLFGTESRGR